VKTILASIFFALSTNLTVQALEFKTVAESDDGNILIQIDIDSIKKYPYPNIAYRYVELVTTRKGQTMYLSKMDCTGWYTNLAIWSSNLNGWVFYKQPIRKVVGYSGIGAEILKSVCGM
jgi:hypothetical protein